MDEVLVDYAERQEGLYEYFGQKRHLQSVEGTLYRLESGLELTSDKFEELQGVIQRTSDVVCVYGFGKPPEPSQIGPERWARWLVNTYFDVQRLWNDPTHLKGQERLVWAGRISNRWYVVKERLSEPLEGGVVWYEFAPPVFVEPVFQ